MFEIIIVATMKLCLFHSIGSWDHKDKFYANIHFYEKTKSNINIQDA